MRITVLFAIFTLTPAAALGQTGLPTAFFKPAPETVQDLKAIETHVQDLVERVMPATVCLRVGNAQGSGVIINRDGYILTAGHVSGAVDRDVTIILSDGRRLRGRTLGANNGIDSGMCLITDKAEFQHLDMGRSADLKKGQWCLSLGHPGGYKPGRPPVVRLGRLQEISPKQLVSDCALVGGDSGGPLFDMHGRVIGIHSRIGGKVSSNVHVPVDTYRETWTKLAAGNVWGNPFAFLDSIRPGEAYLGMRVSLDKKALKVDSVTPGSPAERAGLKANDIVLKLDTKAPASPDDVANFVQVRRPGTRISIHVQRGNETLAIDVVLGKRAQ